MAIGLLFEIPGMTQEHYDATAEALWETRADFDRFAEETLAPLMGGQIPVAVELPIHAFQVQPA